MGRVKIDIDNEPLYLASNYSNINTLKILFRNYNLIEKLAHKGDSTALAIYADLRTALGFYKDCQVLTDKQRKIMILFSIYRLNVKQIADIMHISHPTVTYHVKCSLKRISKYLTEGERE